jgi:hypothetical protein
MMARYVLNLRPGCLPCHHHNIVIASPPESLPSQDIDSILEQRAHVLVTENAQQTENWLNKRKKAGKAK